MFRKIIADERNEKLNGYYTEAKARGVSSSAVCNPIVRWFDLSVIFPIVDTSVIQQFTEVQNYLAENVLDDPEREKHYYPPATDFHITLFRYDQDEKNWREVLSRTPKTKMRQAAYSLFMEYPAYPNPAPYFIGGFASTNSAILTGWDYDVLNNLRADFVRYGLEHNFFYPEKVVTLKNPENKIYPNFVHITPIRFQTRVTDEQRQAINDYLGPKYFGRIDLPRIGLHEHARRDVLEGGHYLGDMFRSTENNLAADNP
jgi:hypothetical protein